MNGQRSLVKASAMRITVDDSLTGRGDVDLDVTSGTSLSEVVADFRSPDVWCGSRKLDPDHRAGSPPLVAGAVLSALPRRNPVDPGSLHLAAIAGPDAGVLIAIDSPTTVGSAPPSAVLRDEACDAHHATFTLTPRGEVHVHDEGTVNGTGVWSLRAGILRWRGRRRHAALRSGDVVAIGRTLLRVRGAGAAEGSDAPSRLPTSAPHLVIPTAVPWRSGATLDLEAWPDPTRIGAGGAEWAAPIAIRGPHALEAARAVILARGRRPPATTLEAAPLTLNEPWLSWLPDPLPSDGPIRIGASEGATDLEGWVVLTADADGTTREHRGFATRGPSMRVRADTAQALVRSMASSLPEPPPRWIGWAHAASLNHAPSNTPLSRAVVAGVRADAVATPWRVEMGPSSRLTLIAGAAGSGKTTLVATIAGALAVSNPPHELDIVILCAGDPGPLEPYLQLPHVSAYATQVHAVDALSLLASVPVREAYTVVIADDLDRLGADGRAVAARLESLAVEGDGSSLHVIMATGRPAAVFTPSLRAAHGTAVALRAERPADSVEVIGIDAASRLPHDSPGRALVRSSGRIDAVHVALPWADAPHVRPWGAPAPGVRSLAEAVRSGPVASSAGRPLWRDPGRPAS